MPLWLSSLMGAFVISIIGSLISGKGLGLENFDFSQGLVWLGLGFLWVIIYLGIDLARDADWHKTGDNLRISTAVLTMFYCGGLPGHGAQWVWNSVLFYLASFIVLLIAAEWSNKKRAGAP